MDYTSLEYFILLWVFAEKPLLEILHRKSVILGKSVAICIEPFTTVNLGCYGVVVGVVVEFHRLNADWVVSLCYLHLWRVVRSAGPLTYGEVEFASFHFLCIDVPQVVVTADCVLLLSRSEFVCKACRLTSAAVCYREHT